MSEPVELARWMATPNLLPAIVRDSLLDYSGYVWKTAGPHPAAKGLHYIEDKQLLNNPADDVMKVWRITTEILKNPKIFSDYLYQTKQE